MFSLFSGHSGAAGQESAFSFPSFTSDHLFSVSFSFLFFFLFFFFFWILFQCAACDKEKKGKPRSLKLKEGDEEFSTVCGTRYNKAKTVQVQLRRRYLPPTSPTSSRNFQWNKENCLLPWAQRPRNVHGGGELEEEGEGDDEDQGANKNMVSVEDGGREGDVGARS